MPEPVLQPAEQQPVATISPHQDDPVLAKGFDDPVFLQAAEKAFKDAALQRSKPVAKEAPVEAPEPRTQPEPAEETPRSDRPPTPRKASEWAAFHEAKVKVEKERDELKSRLDKLNGFDPKEYETLKVERQKLAEKLDSVALERSDKFQNYFNTEKENIASLIKTAMGEKADKVMKLLEMPDSDWRTEQLEALSENLTPLRRARLERACADMDKLQVERNGVMDKSAENWKKLQEVEKQERINKEAEMSRIFEAEIKSLSDAKNGIQPFQEVEGDHEWNKGIKGRVDLAKAIFNGEVSPQERARASAHAAMMPDILKMMSEGMKEYEKLKGELEKLRASEPGLEHTPGEGKPSGKELEGLSYGEAIARMVEQAGGFSGR